MVDWHFYWGLDHLLLIFQADPLKKKGVPRSVVCLSLTSL